MPIYEYRRPDGTKFEVMQSFSEEPLAADPASGVPVERVLHAPALHFKGKGFYNTDYGTRKRQRETEAAGKGSSDTSSNGASGEKDSSPDGKAKADASSKADGSTKTDGSKDAPKPAGAKKVAAKS
jgi:putative FmdB family regulatory protein